MAVNFRHENCDENSIRMLNLSQVLNGIVPGSLEGDI